MNVRSTIPALLALAAACSQNGFNPAAINEVVVDGCLIAGAPVDSIRLSPLIPYGAAASASNPITNASPTISDKANVWPLVATGDSGYYRGADTSFRPIAGETYTFTVSYGGKNISAVTVVPQKTLGIALSSDTLTIDTTMTMYEMMQAQRSGQTIPEITLKFKNPTLDYYYVVVQNVDSAPVALSADTLRFRGSRFLSSPAKDTDYVITFAQINALGRHRVTLYHVNQEYADLYNRQTQDSRDLVEPATNVVNGLGIFTAVNCDSVFFYAVAGQ